jgi:hypothetical protein
MALMFEKNRNNQEPDALDERIHGLRNGLRASARLKAAAIDGEPLRRPIVQTRTHVWRFTKAVVAYALGVMLLLGVVTVLPAIWDSDLISSPGTTTEPIAKTPIEREIISAYAKQFGKNESKLSVRIVAEYGDVYAVYVDEDGFAYEDEMIEEVVHFYPFRYTNTQTMSIYKDGRIYTLPDAYEAGVFTAKNVLDLYLLHAEKEGYLDEKDPKKVYCSATLEDDYDADEIIIVVFPEYNDYPYTAEDFLEIGCIEVKDLTVNIQPGQLCRILYLRLSAYSKQNVLDCVKMLELREDIYCAEPSYNIEPD